MLPADSPENTNHMKTKYYCSKCEDFLTDNKIPNINKRHQRCGSVLKVLLHEESAEGDSEEVE